MTAGETLVQVVVVLGFGLYAWSKISNKSMGEVVSQIRELISGLFEKKEEYLNYG